MKGICLSLVYATLVSGFIGCAGGRLHDPAALKAIEDAKDNFTEYQKEAAKVIAGTSDVVAESDAFLAELRRDFGTLAFLTEAESLPDRTIASIKASIEEQITRINGKLDDLKSDLEKIGGESSKISKELQELVLAKQLAADKFASFQSKVKEQNERIDKFRADYKNFLDSLSRGSRTAPLATVSQSDPLKLLQESLIAVSEAARIATSQAGSRYVDVLKEGALASELNQRFGSIFLFKKKDGTIDEEKLAELKSMLEGVSTPASTLLKVVMDPSPGLQGEILRLQADLVQSQVDLTQARVRQMDALSRNFVKRTELLKQMVKMLSASRKALNFYSEDATLLALLGQWRQQQQDTGADAVEARDEARELIRGLGQYLLVRGYFDSPIRQLEVDASKVKRDFAIAKSSIQQRRYGTLVAFGIDGITAYHREGIRSEDIANLLRALQTAGIGVISGMID